MNIGEFLGLPEPLAWLAFLVVPVAFFFAIRQFRQKE